jgi:predicted dehydrogenase
MESPSRPHDKTIVRTALQCLLLAMGLLCLVTCKTPTEDKRMKVQLITVDPGHFHAALVQKTMYSTVDSTVYVYAPDGPDVKMHLDRINTYNTRKENPTHWNEVVYKGNDFFDKMLSDKKGNVIVLAGNNEKKSEYISRSISNGFHVLADKPMAINQAGFNELKMAFDTAASNDLLLYDIMTERFEITTLLQRELSRIPAVFGTLENGSPENPAIIKESVHHFYKSVSGSPLIRPAWFLDVGQQGEGIVDVTTHLVDLVQWECFPEQAIDYKKDIELLSARRFATDISLTQFKSITRLENFPEGLTANLKNDTTLSLYCNGEINYKLRGMHARVGVTWNYKAPEGAEDTHYSILRGTKANLIIRHEGNVPSLFVQPVKSDPLLDKALKKIVEDWQTVYPGLDLRNNGKEWEFVIPNKYREGHEAHFARVMTRFLEYLEKKNMPEWEIPNMIAKYYTTTQALEMATRLK